MRIYRNNYSLGLGTGDNAGYSFHTTKKEAQKAAHAAMEKKPPLVCKRGAMAQPIDIRCTEAGLVRCMNLFASHADKGE